MRRQRWASMTAAASYARRPRDVSQIIASTRSTVLSSCGHGLGSWDVLSSAAAATAKAAAAAGTCFCAGSSVTSSTRHRSRARHINFISTTSTDVYIGIFDGRPLYTAPAAPSRWCSCSGCVASDAAADDWIRQQHRTIAILAHNGAYRMQRPCTYTQAPYTALSNKPPPVLNCAFCLADLMRFRNALVCEMRGIHVHEYFKLVMPWSQQQRNCDSTVTRLIPRDFCATSAVRRMGVAGKSRSGQIAVTSQM